MKASECEDFCRRLIDNRAWGLWVRVVEWVFAVISLALIAFSFSQFKGYADYKGWVWGPIGVAFAAWAVVSLPVRVVLGWTFRALWFDILTLFFHWVDCGFFLIINVGMYFTVRKQANVPYCVASTGERIHSTECNAIYATLAFAGVDLLLSFICAILVSVPIRLYWWRRYKDRCNKRNVRRISSPGEPTSQINEEV